MLSREKYVPGPGDDRRALVHLFECFLPPLSFSGIEKRSKRYSPRRNDSESIEYPTQLLVAASLATWICNLLRQLRGTRRDLNHVRLQGPTSAMCEFVRYF